MTKYRILKVGNHYEVDRQGWFNSWRRVCNLADFPIKFNTMNEAEIAINLCNEEEHPTVVKYVNS